MTYCVLGEITRILLTFENEFPKLLRLGPQALLLDLIHQSLSALMPVLKLTVITAIMIYDNDEYSSQFQLNCTRVGTLIVATIYLQLIQNRYMFRSFTVFHCSHQDRKSVV